MVATIWPRGSRWQRPWRLVAWGARWLVRLAVAWILLLAAAYVLLLMR